MPRLRRVDCGAAGITRRRRGRGFEYLDEDGQRIEHPDVLERIRALAIPPAWEDVWICADPLGHIQATGVDARSRKQYRYHDLFTTGSRDEGQRGRRRPSSRRLRGTFWPPRSGYRRSAPTSPPGSISRLT